MNNIRVDEVLFNRAINDNYGTAPGIRMNFRTEISKKFVLSVLHVDFIIIIVQYFRHAQSYIVMIIHNKYIIHLFYFCTTHVPIVFILNVKHISKWL